jgi:hypothetical protein
MRVPIIITAISIIMLAPSVLPGQEKPEPYEAAIIPVKTLSGDSFNRLGKLLSVFGAKYIFDDKLRTIVVYAPKDVVAQMRRVVEQLDQPGSEAAIGRNIEITLAFLRCSATPAPDARPLPADLEPAAKQLRAATQYKNIQLWDIVPVHLQEGKITQQSFRLPTTIPNVPSAVATAQLRILPEAVSRKTSGRYVRFEQMNINFRIPHATGTFQAGVSGQGVSPLVNTQFNYIDVGLNTAGEFREGQKTILGKISGIDDESAVFVVISLKVLDE